MVEAPIRVWSDYDLLQWYWQYGNGCSARRQRLLVQQEVHRRNLPYITKVTGSVKLAPSFNDELKTRGFVFPDVFHSIAQRG